MSSERTSEKGDLPELEGMATISWAAKILGVTRQQAHRMAQDRKFKAWRMKSGGEDRPVVVMEAEVLALAEQRRQSEVSLRAG